MFRHGMVLAVVVLSGVFAGGCRNCTPPEQRETTKLAAQPRQTVVMPVVTPDFIPDNGVMPAGVVVSAPAGK